MINPTTRSQTLKKKDMLAHTIEEYFNDEVEFLQNLVRAKSANTYTAENAPPDVPVEAEAATIIHEKMRQFGWLPSFHGVTNQRQNILCTPLRSSISGKTLILTTHMDTVPVSDGYSRDPWSAEIESGRMYGVGVADAKAQIAAFMYAVKALSTAGIKPRGNVSLAFVVDEETGASSPYGTRFLLENGLLNGDAAIVGEPGDDKIAIGHRGVYRFKIKTYGVAVHTGMKAWELKTNGHNAVLDMSRIIQKLAMIRLKNKRFSIFPGRKNVLTFPTLIQGGSGVNIVPDSCEAYGDARLLPNLSVNDIKRKIQEALGPLHIRYDLIDILTVPSAKIVKNASIVRNLSQAIGEVRDTLPRIEGAGPACDGWLFINKNIDTICGYGVKCGGIHGADEWADLKSLKELTEIYAKTIIYYLGEER